VIIPTGTCQVNLQFVGDNLPTGAEITFGVDNSTLDASPATVAGLIEDSIVGAGWMAAFVNDESIANIHVKNGPNETGPFADLGVTIGGEKTGEGSSSAVALLVKKNTGLGGKKGSGRLYIPGIAESDIGSDGTIDSTALGVYQASLSDWLSEMTSLDVPMLLLHNDATTPNLVLSLAVDPVAATQRRRQRR